MRADSMVAQSAMRSNQTSEGRPPTTPDKRRTFCSCLQRKSQVLAHDDGYCVAAILPDLGSKPTLCGLS
jgi:hypothetical protein